MSLSNLLHESLTQEEESRVRSIISSELVDFKKEIEKMTEEQIDKQIKKEVPTIFEKYHQILWQRRGSWSGALKK